MVYFRVRVADDDTYVKLSRAERLVGQAAYCWVEPGKVIRRLTLAESIAARNEQARLREPLAVAELPGLKFEPPVSGLEACRVGRRMVLDATAICAGLYHPSAERLPNFEYVN